MRLRDEATIRLRNESWRVRVDVGLTNGLGGFSRHTVSEIAAETGLSPQHIRAGIRAARRIRRQVHEVCSFQALVTT